MIVQSRTQWWPTVGGESLPLETIRLDMTGSILLHGVIVVILTLCRFTPDILLPYKWESSYTIQKSSYGYDRTEGLESFLNISQLLMQLVSSVSCNGNLLLNIGPTADGRILPAFEERLLQMGAWLEVSRNH